jgi:hypothetical protein
VTVADSPVKKVREFSAIRKENRQPHPPKPMLSSKKKKHTMEEHSREGDK